MDDEIKVVAQSFMKNFEETGFIESATKCHVRVQEKYAILNRRISPVQCIM